jgi:hypothetical protein
VSLVGGGFWGLGGGVCWAAAEPNANTNVTEKAQTAKGMADNGRAMAVLVPLPIHMIFFALSIVCFPLEPNGFRSG